MNALLLQAFAVWDKCFEVGMFKSYNVKKLGVILRIVIAT
jgi:hypothetical protein